MFIDKILILHCFNHPSFSNVLQQKNVVMKGMYFTKVPEISTEGSTLINSIKQRKQLKKAMYLKDFEELLKFFATSS